MMGIVVKMMGESTEFFLQYLDNKNFQNVINKRVSNKCTTMYHRDNKTRKR